MRHTRGEFSTSDSSAPVNCAVSPRSACGTPGAELIYEPREETSSSDSRRDTADETRDYFNFLERKEIAMRARERGEGER